MVETGLVIDEKEFLSLPTKKQMGILYQNQVETLRLIRGYTLNQRVQYILISAAITGVGLLFSIEMGII
ncbi:MAG: hypothetical protein WCV90_09025 [Candidatus Woesearchaeota archaeon]